MKESRSWSVCKLAQAACRPIMSIDVVEVVIWRESSVSGGSGAVQMFLRWQDRKSGSAGMPRPISTLFPYTTLFRSAACRPIMSIDVVEVVIWRESSVSGGSGAVQMFLRWQQRKRSEERFSRNAETD